MQGGGGRAKAVRDVAAGPGALAWTGLVTSTWVTAIRAPSEVSAWLSHCAELVRHSSVKELASSKVVVRWAREGKDTLKPKVYVGSPAAGDGA